MKLIRFLASFSCIWFVGEIPALSEKFSLVELSNYLNRLNALKANVRQVAEDGCVARGSLVIKKTDR